MQFRLLPVAASTVNFHHALKMSNIRCRPGSLGKANSAEYIILVSWWGTSGTDWHLIIWQLVCHTFHKLKFCFTLLYFCFCFVVGGGVLFWFVFLLLFLFGFVGLFVLGFVFCVLVCACVRACAHVRARSLILYSREYNIIVLYKHIVFMCMACLEYKLQRFDPFRI